MRKQIKISFRTKCEICGKELAVINYFHLKSHNITIKEYKEKFPESYVSYREIKLNGEPPFCSCGCGQRVKKYADGRAVGWAKFISGHNRKGCTNGENQKRAASLARKGKPIKISLKNEIKRRKRISKTMIGYVKTKEHCKNLSLSMKKLFEDKTKCPNWRGGKSYIDYPIEFDKKLKNKIKERDNNRCALCKSTKRLQVHHINYEKHNIDHNNLITLCTPCHFRTNWNRKTWKMIFNYMNKINNDYLFNKFSQLSII